MTAIRANWASSLNLKSGRRAAAFAFDLDRIRYIHSHSVLRQILSRYTDREPSRLVFERTSASKASSRARVRARTLICISAYPTAIAAV